MIVAPVLSNNATSTLAASILAGATVLTISAIDAPKFPAPSAGHWFPLTLIDTGSGNMEIVRCTARAGAVLTVVRAQEGTTATDFAPGTRVSCRLTAAVVAELVADTAELAAELVITNATKLDADDLPPAMDTKADKTFASASDILANVAGAKIVTPNAIWDATKFNGGAASGSHAMDMNAASACHIGPTTGNVTLSVTNGKQGQTGVFFVSFGAAHTLSFSGTWKWPNGAVPTTVGVAGGKAIIAFFCAGDGVVHANYVKYW